MANQGKPAQIPAARLRLDLKNYRHEPVKREEDAIAFLLQKEKVLELALDIAEEGLNPLDRLGVVEMKGPGASKSYVAVEGNRRVCALLLLYTPEKIPSSHPNRTNVVKRLERAARKADLPQKVDCVVFANKKAAKPWIDRMHLGEAHGRSRKRWTADQQERAMGGGRNKDAMAILDLAERNGLISADD
ncbi:hypothetical protein [Citreimonas salinaria]|uniref:Uncharacterized protein n=1 Tax=Citreimonas salinaria TaxID=321339 RepID=A0A1H3KR88_9RHOB|nr:hypothetical protein [Citreimonas salinaria]SDY54580.1 hypothetical protein SAMN05444340_11056 [Citreimonas salinaria]